MLEHLWTRQWEAPEAPEESPRISRQMRSSSVIFSFFTAPSDIFGTGMNAPRSVKEEKSLDPVGPETGTPK